MRKAHALKSNKGMEQPDLVVYLDSESRVDPETLQHSPYLLIGCFCRYSRQKENWQEYTGNFEQFWEAVARFGGNKKKRVFLYAHNLAYDTLVTGGIKTLCKLGFRVVNFFEKGPVFLMTMQNEAGKKLEFVSSTNYFSESLASLGKTFGLEKLEYDYSGGTLEDAKTYCRRDVEILKVAVESFRDFIKSEDLGVLARTAAGQAFNAYRHRFMDYEIFIHDHEAALKLEREAYSGGRVECFRIGSFKGGFYDFDVNSMYPYVMLTYRYPTRLVSFRKRGDPEDLARLIDDGYLVIARCHVMTPELVVGCKLDGHFIFPIGDFWTSISTPEIKYLLERGWIMEVGEIAVYEGAPIFKRYVDYFYTKRLEAKSKGDKVRDKLFKLLMNSLYGKFGQTGETWEAVGEADPEQVGVIEKIDAETGKREVLKVFGGTIFKKVDEQESYNSFPAIAAHVTAYARMTLLNFIQIAGPENVYYSDTDSLFVNEEGKNNLLPYHDEKTLGRIKLEAENDKLIIFAPKDYEFGSVKKQKGVKKGSKKIAENEFETEIWPHLNSFIREGLIAGYHNVKRIKRLRRQYDKGWVLSDGRVVPLQLTADSTGTWIIPWEETLYCRQGEKLANPEQPAWIRKAYPKSYLDREAEERQLRLNYEKIKLENVKAFKKAVMSLGGVNDPDYMSIPRWCKRRKGKTLDYLLSELTEAGFYFESANELYQALWEAVR